MAQFEECDEIELNGFLSVGDLGLAEQRGQLEHLLTLAHRHTSDRHQHIESTGQLQSTHLISIVTLLPPQVDPSQQNVVIQVQFLFVQHRGQIVFLLVLEFFRNALKFSTFETVGYFLFIDDVVFVLVAVCLEREDELGVEVLPVSLPDATFMSFVNEVEQA